jgi:hypothetical protein
VHQIFTLSFTLDPPLKIFVVIAIGIYSLQTIFVAVFSDGGGKNDYFDMYKSNV